MAHNQMTFDATGNHHPALHNYHHQQQQQQQHYHQQQPQPPRHQHQQQPIFSLQSEIGTGLDQQAGLVTTPNAGVLSTVGLHSEHYPPSAILDRDQPWPTSSAAFNTDPTHAFLDYGHSARKNLQSKPATSSTSPPLPSTNVQSSVDKGQALDPSKVYHPEWGVTRDQDFHPLTLKHQRDLENLFQAGNSISDFYFWQANLGGYCMADMLQNIVVSSEGTFPLVRRMVEGAPHPGRRTKKKNGMG